MASVPRACWMFIAPFDVARAAVIHDLLYKTIRQFRWAWQKDKVREPKLELETAKQAKEISDKIFSLSPNKNLIQSLVESAILGNLNIAPQLQEEDAVGEGDNGGPEDPDVVGLDVDDEDGDDHGGVLVPGLPQHHHLPGGEDDDGGGVLVPGGGPPGSGGPQHPSQHQPDSMPLNPGTPTSTSVPSSGHAPQSSGHVLQSSHRV